MALVSVNPSHRTSDEEDTKKRIDRVASLFGAKHSSMKVTSSDGRSTLRYAFLGGSPVFVVRRSGCMRYAVFSNMDNQQALENYLLSQYKSGANFVLLDHRWDPTASQVKVFATVFVGLFLNGYDLSKLNRVDKLDALSDTIMNSYMYDVRRQLRAEMGDVIRAGPMSDRRIYWPGCSIVGKEQKFVYDLKIHRFTLSKRFEDEIAARHLDNYGSHKLERKIARPDETVPRKRVKCEENSTDGDSSQLFHLGEPSWSFKREPTSPDHGDVNEWATLKQIKEEPISF